MAVLKIMSGSLADKEIELHGDAMVVGRGQSCDIRIQDQGVSSKHAKIWKEDGEWFLLDLGSTNGTFLNNKDVDRSKLNGGDKITFGMTLAVFMDEEAEAEPEPPPPPRRQPAQGRAGAPPRGASTMMDVPKVAPPPPPQPVDHGAKTSFGQVDPYAAPPARAPAAPMGYGGGVDSVELETIRGQVSFLEQENRQLKSKIKETEERVERETTERVRAEQGKLRDMLNEKDERIKLLEKMNQEREAWYSPQDMERERKRMEAGVETDRRRETDQLQRQIKELEHRISVRGAETEAGARVLKEKDDLIQMLSEREDTLQGEIKKREEKIQELETSHKEAKDNLTAAQAKEAEAADKLKLKNQQLADLGKQRALDMQEMAKLRALATRVAGGEGGAAVEAAAQQAEELAKLEQKVASVEAELNKAREEQAAAQSHLKAAETKEADLVDQIDKLQGEITDAKDSQQQAEVQLKEYMARQGDFEKLQKQLAMVTAERDTRAASESELSAKAGLLESDVQSLRQHVDDLIQERDTSVAKLKSMEGEFSIMKSDKGMVADWEARYRSTSETVELLRKELSLTRDKAKAEVEALKAAGAAGGGDPEVLAFLDARGLVYERLVQDMLEGVNNAVSVLRRNAEVMGGYVQDTSLLANSIRKIDYTRLEPEQQMMLRELVDETQPDVIVKNMASMGEENSEHINRAKRLILDYTDAFKVAAEEAVDLERSFAKAQGLAHATRPDLDVAVKVEAALPPLGCTHAEATLFAYSLLCEAGELKPEGGDNPAIQVDTDGLSISLTVKTLDAKAKERYKEAARGAGELRARVAHGFATKRCAGSFSVQDVEGGAAVVITLKAAL